MTDIQTWPLNIDFTIAVQNPHLCFADPDLKQSSTSKNSRGRVLLWSGNFATVYKLTKGNRSWAVRCFTRIPQSDVQQRYRLISQYLSQHQIPYLVDFEFLPQGILVKGEWYPILKMDWVEGSELDRYIGDYIDDSQVLLRLDRQLQQLQKDLQQVGIAHGDLQHGNIMVDDQGELKLVDYDGMYVPALLGTPPLELGHPNYQPPMRSPKDFGDQLDEFSFEVISLSLRALASQPNLWETFHEDNKNLIFRQNDFQEPELSPVFQSIANIPDDETRALCDRLIRRCHGKEHSKTPNSKEQFKFVIASYKPFLWIFLTVLLVGGTFWFFRTKQTQPTVIKSPEISPSSSPTPTPIPTSNPIPPKLTPITATTLQAKYAEGQRDFRYVQLTGTQGDRLQGQDFSNINLSGSVLERVDLRQVIFRNANLNGIKIVKVDLRGADLSNSSLVDANLAFSNLTEANLSQANLLRANLFQAKLGSALLQKSELMKSNLSEADLSSANLKGANLVLTNLRKANLVKANLSESNLSAANLSDAILDDADLSLADLRSAELHLTNLSNAIL
ncbi:MULTISPECIES: pentapeptide repeat-containing protein [Pseudanabaena]|uniref:pentapeptide repeat-containing protein n=1 Tax=Pseudanabaena TaxID=1152 RepID=UPI0024787826|nr:MULTISPECIES: pentapeptide repeat-containing protein [Pseudanabaena]MEA5487124.1 pentapeptide repeat-containing protein [Pseudanabaena sp. CCNP1317]WGS71541.1 pentapeptide repeat-containing protein [Pseudanabaena galeata CCNP1313]